MKPMNFAQILLAIFFVAGLFTLVSCSDNNFKKGKRRRAAKTNWSNNQKDIGLHHVKFRNDEAVPIHPDADAFLAKMKSEIFHKNGTSSFPLKKTIYSDKKRVLFVAGMEGSGHHALHSMFDECFKAEMCSVQADMTHHSMYIDKKTMAVKGLFGPEHGEESVENLKLLYTAFRTLADKDSDKLHLIGLSFVALSAMMSYPNYNGNQKALQLPDITMLAYLSEAVGLDFRVLVLQRGAAEIMASTESRNIGGKFEERVLITTAASLYAQMSLLDSRFYHCVQYKELGGMNGKLKSSFVNFIHPISLKEPVIDKMLEKIQYSAPKVDNSTHNEELSANDYHVFHLEKRLSLIDGLCKVVVNQNKL